MAGPATELHPDALPSPGSLGLDAFVLHARALADDLTAGLHRGRRHGAAAEFQAHRPYQPGDDVRRLDWKVLARRDEPHIRQTEQEARLPIQLVLDASGSMGFGEAAARKLRYATWLFAVLAQLAAAQHDTVGLVVVGQTTQHVLARTPSTLIEVLRALHQAEAAGPADGDRMGSYLASFEQRVRPRGMLVLASDLFDSSGQVVPALRRLATAGMDVSVLHTLARAEREFPFDGLTRFISLETSGEMRVNASSLRREYRARMTKFCTHVEAELTAAGIAYHAILTDEPLRDVMWRLLGRRKPMRKPVGAPRREGLP